MLKVPGLIVFVLCAALALGAAAEKPKTTIQVVPADGGASEVRAEGGERIRVVRGELPQELLKRFRLQAPEASPEATGPCLAAAGDADGTCATGRQLSQMKPCLAVSDCEAFALWEKRVGELGPRSAVRARPLLLQTEEKK